MNRCCAVLRLHHATTMRLTSGAEQRPRQYYRSPPNWSRVLTRKMTLERQRQQDSARNTPPVEPSPLEATRLYRQLLKTGRRQLALTDKEYFRRKLRYEFEVVGRKTSSRVRGLMFEKGRWMLRNQLGGLL